MKVNRIIFDKIKAQYDILKMRAAYIAAERFIISQAAEGNDLTGMQIIESFESMTPEEFNEFEVDGFGNIRNKSPKEVILNKMNEIALKAEKYLEQEKYELVQELKEIYEKYKQEYDRL